MWVEAAGVLLVGYQGTVKVNGRRRPVADDSCVSVPLSDHADDEAAGVNGRCVLDGVRSSARQCNNSEQATEGQGDTTQL